MIKKISEILNRRLESRNHQFPGRRWASGFEALRRTLNAALQRKFRDSAVRRPERSATIGGLIRICVAVAGLLLAPLASPAEPAAPRLLLLGEVHDNAAGHARRLAWLNARIAADGLRPAIAMEQFDRERQNQLDQARADCRDADCLIARAGAGDWDWSLYRPLIQFALDQDLPLLAANVSREDSRKATRGGLGAVLDDDTRRRHGADGVLPADIVAAQFAEIVDGHCGQLPEAVARKMVDAQIARDIWMAKVLAEGVARQGSAVLIAGNGHVRRDVGVPRWLPPALAVAAEVHGYVEGEAAAEEFDVVHRVAPQPRPDPCAEVSLPGAAGAGAAAAPGSSRRPPPG